MSNQSNSTVSLGCGTLIAIAIIVAVFSSDSDISREIRQLRGEVKDLTTQVDALATEIRNLTDRVKVIQPATDAPNAEQPVPQ